MSHTEIEILKYLWSRKNETVKREDILSQVYGIDGEITAEQLIILLFGYDKKLK